MRKNILWRQHSAKQAAEKFNLAEEEVNKVVDRGLKALKKYRDDTRERPGLDDKVRLTLPSLSGTQLM